MNEHGNRDMGMGVEHPRGSLQAPACVSGHVLGHASAVMAL